MEPADATEFTCRELVELVTDYLEGALTGDEHARFEAHLAECEGCRRYVDQMRTTVDLTRASGAVHDAPPQMDALLEAFRGYKRRL
jgi:predicted anti-sigma-YlaC factor YlaD